ncbi:MAG: hypothetical protein QM758_28645 [Armatimonas sp.]
MFKRVSLIGLAAFGLLGLLGLMGCGGGSDDSSDIDRELIAGGDQKTWTLRSIKGNANFTGGGVDTACPASLPKIGSSGSFACGSSDTIIMRETGTFNYRGISGISWTLSGSTITLDLGSFGVLTAEIIKESDTRLRVRQISRVVGGVRNTDEDGCELVIEVGTPA